MKNYFDALKRRKDETGESGFSLIELIVVVVILGILAAIAVPVFTGLQGQANKGTLETAVANGASQVASDLGLGKEIGAATDAATADTAWGNLNKLAAQSDGIELTLSGTTIENYCVTGTSEDWSPSGTETAPESGPCP